jgi:DNA-binding XRE family transcriptional regulator
MIRRQTEAIPPDYAARVKAFRLRRGLSQTALADLLGVSFASVSRWENGKARPTQAAWRRITQAEVAGNNTVFPAGQQRALHDEPTGYEAPAAPPPLDFLGDPHMVQVADESEQLS